MYINVTDKREADNKGSCAALVNYLEKENRVCLKDSPEMWFNGSGRTFEPFEVRRSIDGNVAKLGREDSKFYLVNVSPSQKELRHMEEKFGKDSMSEALKNYAAKVMDEYARNFRRPGIESGDDLLWFAKIEHNRYYGHADKEVKSGAKKRGELKQGDQRHIQIIVSRRDISNKIKLSPMNSSRGKNEAHSKKMGQFDRMAFKQCGETLFDKEFGFDRQFEDTMAYANIQKNGSVQQRVQLDILEKGKALHYDSDQKLPELLQKVSQGQFETPGRMLASAGELLGSFLDIMLEPVEVQRPEPLKLQKKKRRKSLQQDHSMGMGR
ncbi:MAG: DUF5712 family protein [Pedobacter sp.]